MLVDPSTWLANFMQLTKMNADFKAFILALGIGYIGLAWTSEHYIFPRLAKNIGIMKAYVSRKPKERKVYKTVLEHMRTLQ